MRTDNPLLRALDWKKLGESIPDLVSIHDRNYRILWANHRFFSKLGINSEDIVGKKCYEIVHHTDVPWPTCPHKEALITGKISEEEVEIGDKLFLVSCAPISLGGELRGSVHIAKDITEYKRAEKALRESEKRFRQLSEASFEGIAIHDKGKILDANQAFTEMFGYELSEVIGMHALEFTAPESHDLVLKNILSGFEEPYEAEGLRKDGSTFVCELCGKAIPYHGRLVRVTAIRDITERKKAEEARAFLANITEYATDAIVGVDLNTNVVSWNRGAEMLFGYSVQEIIGKPWSLVVPKGAREACRKRFKKATIKGFVKATETMRVAKEGGRFPAEMTLTALKDATGEHIGFVIITRDISERKEAEEAIKKYARELEDANRLKDLFIDIMRHDLLNPAGIVRGVTELLLGEDPDKQELQMIKRSSDKLIDMIESASKLAKLESVEELEKESLDLREVISNMVEDCKPLLEAADMRVENRVTGVMPVKANPVIGDIFLNLLSNAAKYAADGKKVVIEALEEDEDYTVMIRDYGPGIPDEDKADIFKRFTRMEKAGVKGAGLGLAIVKRIVDLHNGRAWVEDNPGGGSIFYVELPRA